ncbi:MAG: uracil phosphoribosyltransferase [Gemmataceae bacterium]
MVEVHISSHPLVRHKLAQLRAVATQPPHFRCLVRDLTQLLFVEASTALQTESVTIQTPLAPSQEQRLADKVGLVPILRAGLGMVDPILELIPEASVWHLLITGIFRDEGERFTGKTEAEDAVM